MKYLILILSTFILNYPSIWCCGSASVPLGRNEGEKTSGSPRRTESWLGTSPAASAWWSLRWAPRSWWSVALCLPWPAPGSRCWGRAGEREKERESVRKWVWAAIPLLPLLSLVAISSGVYPHPPPSFSSFSIMALRACVADVLGIVCALISSLRLSACRRSTTEVSSSRSNTLWQGQDRDRQRDRETRTESLYIICFRFYSLFFFQIQVSFHS